MTNHILKKSKKDEKPTDIIFFDTETKTEKQENFIAEKFHLGWIIHAHYENGKKTLKEIYIDKPQTLWEYIDKIGRNTTVFAHNAEFDMKVSNAYDILINKLEYTIEQFYVHGHVFMMEFRKKNRLIKILDTMNYVPVSLKKLGEQIGYAKKDINFKTCTDKELSQYCLNDVRVIEKFISDMMDFMDEINIEGFKSTAGSTALNAFLQRFYDEKKHPIYIHDKQDLIEFERKSYKGGITDLFFYGEIKDRLFKLDINSMYPYIMREKKVPTRFFYHSREKNKLLAVLENNLKDERIHAIADCEISLPLKYALILTKFQISNELKSGFIYGTFRCVLSHSEIEYVKKYGKINYIHELALYDSNVIFKDFVDYFYEKRRQYRQKNQGAYELMTKLMMNSLYGKFGQRKSDYIIYDNPEENEFGYMSGFDEQGHMTIVRLGDKEIHIRQSTENAYNSFVPIASAITSHARVYLAELILKAGIKHVYYCDTDSLIVDRKGYTNLREHISETGKLGKLKLEGISDKNIFYRPKYYVFNEELKCKGVRKDHEVLDENEKNLTIRQNQFLRFNASMKNKTMDKQLIRTIDKIMNKHYDKGVILDTGRIIPYADYQVKVLR